MLDLSKIRAIGLDLDDTLWPIWPTIARAEARLQQWLGQHAPRTAAAFSEPGHRLTLREAVLSARPEISHDMSAVRREMIRAGLRHGGEDPALAEPAFEVFFAHRMQVDLYADALPALRFLSARFPLVAISNGNADVARVGIGEHFHSSVSAHQFGVAKPDVRIFHAAASAAGVPPEAVLHIGDDPRLDVLGALDAGMQTVWLNRDGHAWGHEQNPHLSVDSLDGVCRLFA